MADASALSHSGASRGRDRASELIPPAYLAFLLVFGGGGTPAPLAELACQVVTTLVVAWWLTASPAVWRVPDRKVAWLVAAICFVPLLQLVPLPAALWQALPGGELRRDSLALIAAADTWQPWSIAPRRTLEAVLALAPPLVMLAIAAGLDGQGRRRLLQTIAIVGLVSLVVGAAQLASAGTGALMFYGPTEQPYLLGFQANRNAQADVLLIAALAALAGWHDPAREFASPHPAALAAAGLLALGVVLTGSRTGILLLAATTLSLTGLWIGRGGSIVVHGKKAAGLAAVLAVAVVALWAWQSRIVARAVARFDLTSDQRFDIWQDTWYAIGTYWPLGSGLGTFTRALPAAERLEGIGPALPNRAHNEFLELLLEGGLPLALAWLAAAVIVALALRSALRRASRNSRPPALFAGGVLSIVLMHAAVDYPFRSMALASLIAVAVAMVLAPPEKTIEGVQAGAQ